jgi:hypothetical protein
MPTISRFRGMAIRMYYRREHPPPHFHVIYQDLEAFISIETGEVIHGRLTPALTRMIREWAALRRQQLRANWERGRRNESFETIKGLD